MALNKKYSKIVILFAFALLVALGLGMRLRFLVTDRIAPGVDVAGVQVGGLTEREAAERLRRWAREHLTRDFTLEVAGHNWTGSLRDIGVVVNSDAMARDAYSIGRRGNSWNRCLEALRISKSAESVSAPYRFDEKKIRSLVDKIRSVSAVPAKDATISFSGGIRRIIPDAIGTTIDADASLRAIESAVREERTSVALSIVLDHPNVTVSDLQHVDTLLSRYTTRYPAWRKDRTHNVKLAASAIDGTLLRPDEVFSYNQEVGPRLKEKGFREALIYVRGKIVPGTGGGVCQVSSTVYNAALLANLEIVERSHHSMPVPYVPMGRDATVAYGLLDLKFRNTTSAPVYLAARTAGSRLTVEVYGSAKDKKDVRVITGAPKRIERPNGKVVTAVRVFRVVTNETGESSKIQISYDRYSPAPPGTSVKPKPVRVASRR